MEPLTSNKSFIYSLSFQGKLIQNHAANIQEKMKLLDVDFSIETFSCFKIEQVAAATFVILIKEILCKGVLKEERKRHYIQKILPDCMMLLQAKNYEKTPKEKETILSEFDASEENLKSILKSTFYFLNLKDYLQVPLSTFLTKPISVSSDEKKHLAKKRFCCVVKLYQDLCEALYPSFQNIYNELQSFSKSGAKKNSFHKKKIPVKPTEGYVSSLFNILENLEKWANQVLPIMESSRQRQSSFSSLLRKICVQTELSEKVIHRLDFLLLNYEEFTEEVKPGLRKIINEMTIGEEKCSIAIHHPDMPEKCKAEIREYIVERRQFDFEIFFNLMKANEDFIRSHAIENLDPDSSNSKTEICHPLDLIQYLVWEVLLKEFSDKAVYERNRTEIFEKKAKITEVSPAWFNLLVKSLTESFCDLIDVFVEKRLANMKKFNYFSKDFYDAENRTKVHGEIVVLLDELKKIIDSKIIRSECFNHKNYVEQFHHCLVLFTEKLKAKLSISEKEWREIFNARQSQTIKMLEENNYDRSKAIDSINHLRKWKKIILSLESYICLSTSHLKSLFQECRDNLNITQLTSEKRDLLELLEIDEENEHRKVKFRKKTKSSSSKKNDVEKQQKKREGSKQNINFSEKHALVFRIPILSEISKCLAEEKILSPQDIAKDQFITQESIFALDSKYHLDHVIWALELMIETKESSPKSWGLLIPCLLYHLYNAEEQTLTPLFLNKFSETEVQHGLADLNQALGLSAKIDNDFGTFWNRYPHAHARLYENPKPFALEMMVSADAEMSKINAVILTNFLSLIEKCQLFSIIKDTIVKVATVSSIKGIDVTMFENWLDDLERNQFSMYSIKRNKSPKWMEQISRILGFTSEINVLHENFLKSISEVSKKQALMRDFAVHLKRFSLFIDLCVQFPEQRYLSFHEHHLQMTLQYLVENAMYLILDFGNSGQSKKSHDLTAYVNWESKLSANSVNLIHKINLGKSPEYPFWKSYQRKDLAEKLSKLSQAYKLSSYAIFEGEGTFPSDLNESSFINLHAHLIERIEEGFILAKELLKLI